MQYTQTMSESKEIDREKLADLLAKVQAATGPDRELDSRLLCVHTGEDFEGLIRDGYTVSDINPAEYTASIDAALVLVEKVLPDVMWRLQSDPTTGDGYEASLVSSERFPPSDGRASGATAPLALLAALLSALTEKP